MKRILSILLALVMVIGMLPMTLLTASAAETSVTMSITGSTGSTGAQTISWTSGAVTFTNNQAGSSTAIRTSDTDHYRLYAKSEVIVSCSAGNITKIVVTAVNGTYATALGNSVTKSEVATSGSTVTITPATPAASYTIGSISAQSRIKTVVVTYEPAGSGDTEELPKDCLHPNGTDVAAVEATCTAVGYSAGKYCADCDTYYEGHEEIPMIDHTYVNGVCSCGAVAPTKYVKTDLSDITAQQVVIITMKNSSGVYALSSGNGTGSAPTAVKVTVANDAIETSVENIYWNISNVNGDLTITPAGDDTKWLYCTNANNGVRVGTNENKVFTVDGTYGYLFHTSTSRYVGVYNNADWRCYTAAPTAANNSNIKDQTLAFYVKECLHSNTETNTVDATCGVAGSVTVSCVDCGKVISTEEIAALEHSYVDGVCEHCGEADPSICQHTETTTATVEATCTAAGSVTVTCTNCGEVQSVTEIPALGHAYGEFVTTTEATCTTAGVKTQTCANGCGVDITEEIPALGHNYVDGVCANNCGAKILSGTYYIAAKRAEGNYWYMTSDLGTASTKRYQAVDSGLTELPESITLPEANNQMFEFIYDADTDTYVIKSGDNYLGWSSGNSGALVDEASAKAMTLERVEGQAYYHIYFKTGDATRNLTLNNTSGNNYFAFYTSAQANNLYLIPVAVCKHEKTTTTTVDATCTTEGSETVVCDDCGKTVETNVLEKADHTYVDGACSVCGEADPSICTHENQTTTTVEATCTIAGSVTVTCDDCSAVLSTTEIPAAGHNYVDGKCSVCNAWDTSIGYLMMLEQNNSSVNKTLYATGVMSGNYYATTDVAANAAVVYLETVDGVDGAYRLYTEIEGVKNYFRVYENSATKAYVAIVTEAPAEYYTYGAELGLWTFVGSANTFYLGTYSTFQTISASNVSYINSDNKGVSQFPVQLIPAPTAADATAADGAAVLEDTYSYFANGSTLPATVNVGEVAMDVAWTVEGSATITDGVLVTTSQATVSSYTLTATVSYNGETANATWTGLVVPVASEIAEGTYVITAADGMAMTALTSAYGYMSGTSVAISDGAVTGYSNSNLFTVTANGDGTYTIVDNSGKYVYMSGTYTSFNVSETKPETGADWTFCSAGDGTYYICNVSNGKVISWDATYTSFGAYDDSSRWGTMTLTAAEEIAQDADTLTYVFADYTEGTQYAENEVHVLDEKITMITNQAHFTSQLRLYNSSSADATAVIQSTHFVEKLVLNAGYKVGDLEVYGSQDGETWTLIATVNVTATTYANYTVEILEGSNYGYIKLDSVSEGMQIRIAQMDITFGDEVPDYAAVVNGKCYVTFEEAYAAAGDGDIIKLLTDVELESFTLSKDIVVDLAACSLSINEITVENDAVIYGKDSVSDDFNNDGNEGALIVTGATVAGADGYLAVELAEGIYSFYHYEIKITHVSLKPGADALGYKAEVFGNDTVLSMVASVGFKLWVNENQVVTRSTSGKTAVSLRLQGIMAANGGEMDINAIAFVTFTDGTYAESEKATTSMEKTIEYINDNWSDFDTDKQAAVIAYVAANSEAMKSWNIANIYVPKTEEVPAA